MAKRKVKVLEYNAIFEREKDGGYSVWVPSLPGCCSQGDTFEEALGNIKEAIELYLEGAEKEDFEESKATRDQFMVPVRVGLGHA